MADAAPIEEAVSIEAPEPLLEPAQTVPQLPRPEWTSIGTTYAGKLERLKSEWAPG